MLKYTYVLILSFLFFHANSQNITVMSKRKCASDKSKEVSEATQKFKSVLDAMVHDGVIIHAATYQYPEAGAIQHQEFVVVENEAKFKVFHDDYEKKISKAFPELYKVFLLACDERKDTVMNQPKLYPAIKGEFWSAVVPVKQIDEAPDPKLDYNVVFDLTAYAKVDPKKDQLDSSQVNWGLGDLARIYNLHVAAGIPQKKINFVVAVHGAALFSFLSNEEYKKKYKTDNPNVSLIKELNDAGVKFLACGQAMNWLGIEKPMLLPQTKVTLTAQTTLTSYQLKGYASKAMGNE
jgi:intracellular sulfur oxidation DsrE/DsrF family protein